MVIQLSSGPQMPQPLQILAGTQSSTAENDSEDTAVDPTMDPLQTESTDSKLEPVPEVFVQSGQPKVDVDALSGTSELCEEATALPTVLATSPVDNEKVSTAGDHITQSDRAAAQAERALLADGMVGKSGAIRDVCLLFSP